MTESALTVPSAVVSVAALGLLGVADRWADLAVATWSAEWNYGPGWDKLLLDAYGIRPDPERTRCACWGHTAVVGRHQFL